MIVVYGCYLLCRIFNNQAHEICVRYVFENDTHLQRGRGVVSRGKDRKIVLDGGG